MRSAQLLALALLSPAPLAAAETVEAALLVVGGDESGCAAAVQAARLGIRPVVLVTDHPWLGGQFSTQGVGPIDEWTVVDGKRVHFPRSGAFLEIVERIRAHNRLVYGVPAPGNGWCGSETIEPRAAAQIFEDWLAPHLASGALRIERGWDAASVETEGGRVVAVRFEPSAFAPAEAEDTARSLTVRARLTIDSSDLGERARYLRELRQQILESRVAYWIHWMHVLRLTQTGH